MKHFLMVALFVAAAFSTRVYAVLGVGDVVYDPAANSHFMTMIAQAKEMYATAKAQLDGMVAIEKTINEAQQAYEVLSKFDLDKAVKSLQSGGRLSSFAALRGQIANTEGVISQNVSFVEGNLQRVQQLENLELIRTAAVKNGSQASGKVNALTAAQISAQNSSMQLALQAAEEQRKLKEDAEKAQATKNDADNFKNTKKVYEAMGK
jgi:hypothetical protein